MSEPIIIETPAPPTRERLVLVPPGCPLPILARDATAADLERAGYVTGEMLAEHVRIVWAAGQEAEPVGVAMLRRLKDRAEKAERVAAMAKDIDGHTMADLRDDLRNASARYDEVWAALGTTSALANDTAPNIILAMREDIIGLNADTERLLARAEKAERELEDAESRAAHMLEVIRERDTLRAELARLTAPGEGEPTDGGPWRAYGEPTDQELVDAFEHAYRNAPSVRTHATAIRTLYRLGVAHERARQQPAKDRATDEELVDLYRKIYETHGGGTISVSHDDCRRAGLLAVAAHVRKERCLVAQAVGMGADVSLREIGVDSGSWLIRVCAPSHKPAEATRVPTADVPSTLARLLGEVSR